MMDETYGYPTPRMSGSAHAYTWEARDGRTELSDEQRSEARKMLSLAVEVEADYIAFADRGNKITMEISCPAAFEVEDRYLGRTHR